MAGIQGRKLEDSDNKQLEEFLVKSLHSSLFLLSNIRRVGIDYGDGGAYRAVYWGMFYEGRLVGVISHAWNGMLLLQCPENYLLQGLHSLLRTTKRSVTGLLGPWPQVEVALTLLDARGPAERARVSREILFCLELSKLCSPGNDGAPEGVCRPAATSDLPALIKLRAEYNKEALGKQGGEEESMRRLLEEDALFVLELEGEIVSICAFNAQIDEMVQIGGVFTPQTLRSRGFARRIVAFSLSQAMQAGRTHAVLFTGEDNFPAQAAYYALGFQEIGSYGMVFFPASKSG